MSIVDIILGVKRDAEEDRSLAKSRGQMSVAVYYQGKIAACNEILSGVDAE